MNYLVYVGLRSKYINSGRPTGYIYTERSLSCTLKPVHCVFVNLKFSVIIQPLIARTIDSVIIFLCIAVLS